MEVTALVMGDIREVDTILGLIAFVSTAIRRDGVLQTTYKFKYLLGVQNRPAYPTDMLEKLPEDVRGELVQLASNIPSWREWST